MSRNKKHKAKTHSQQPIKKESDQKKLSEKRLEKNKSENILQIPNSGNKSLYTVPLIRNSLSNADSNINMWSLNLPTTVYGTQIFPVFNDPIKAYNPLSSSVIPSINSVTALSGSLKSSDVGRTYGLHSTMNTFDSADWFKVSQNNPLISGLETASVLSYLSDKSYENLRDFNYTTNSKINDLTKKLNEKVSQINELENKNKSLEETKEELGRLTEEVNLLTDELNTLKGKGHIISRIGSLHISALLKSELFFKKFKDLDDVDAVVISIDIRRSTELMLKAVTPQHFAKFITELSKKLSDCVKSNYGVFDKFTGDGILAFFPKFFSGDHALLFALKTAIECHKIFEDHYNEYEFSFEMYNNEVGLGIGIECGKVAIVNNGVELTVVGTPVVYACRLAGAPSGETFLGLKAMKDIQDNFDHLVEVEKDKLSIKHDGTIRVYKLKKLKEFKVDPDWSDFFNNEENDIQENQIDKETDGKQ